MLHFSRNQRPNPMWHGIARLLEATCATLADPATAAQIPPEVRGKLHSAARKIAEQALISSTVEVRF